MMTLSDVLSARADNARACAQIDCGALGMLTLEALPLRELEQLSRSADADRAIFYAACRDLQRTGAELLRAGKVYRPDQVTALVSDAEAAKAADAVRRLSGFARETSPAGDEADAATASPAAETKDVLSFREKKVHPLNSERKGVGTDLEDGAVDDRGGRAVDDTEAATPTAGADAVVESSGRIAREGGQGDLCRDGVQKVRPKVVQENAEVRHDTVQQDLTENTKIRHSFVQEGGEEVGDGQVSREFLTEKADEPARLDMEQVLWSESVQTPQNVVEMDNLDGGLRNIEPVADNKSTKQERKKSNRAHEGKSESAEELHEITSDFRRGEVREMHESTSEFVETLHESKSEHTEELHETESERAERVARELLEGLRRAAWVR